MLTVPLPYVNFRLNRRIIVTILGITVSVMFVISSFIVVNSLSTSTGMLLDKFKKGNAIIYQGDSISQSQVNISNLDLNEEYAAGIMLEVRVNHSTPSYLVGIYNPWWKSKSAWLSGLNISDSDVKIGRYVSIPSKTGNISISNQVTTVERRINGTFTSVMLPDSWIIASIATLRELAPWMGPDTYSFVIVQNLTTNVAESAENNAMNVDEMPSAISFYTEGTNQLERDLWLVVAIAAVIITILLYTTMSIEILERKRDIGIMRSIGANARTVFFVFFTQAMFIALAGAILGCISGIVASYAVTSLGVHMGYQTLFVVDVPLVLVVIAFGIAVISSAIGGLIPIISATRMKVTECLE